MEIELVNPCITWLLSSVDQTFPTILPPYSAQCAALVILIFSKSFCERRDGPFTALFLTTCGDVAVLVDFDPGFPMVLVTLGTLHQLNRLSYVWLKLDGMFVQQIFNGFDRLPIISVVDLILWGTLISRVLELLCSLDASNSSYSARLLIPQNSRPPAVLSLCIDPYSAGTRSNLQSRCGYFNSLFIHCSAGADASCIESGFIHLDL